MLIDKVAAAAPSSIADSMAPFHSALHSAAVHCITDLPAMSSAEATAALPVSAPTSGNATAYLPDTLDDAAADFLPSLPQGNSTVPQTATMDERSAPSVEDRTEAPAPDVEEDPLTQSTSLWHDATFNAKSSSSMHHSGGERSDTNAEHPETATDSDDVTHDSCSESGTAASSFSAYGPRSQATSNTTHNGWDTSTDEGSDSTAMSIEGADSTTHSHSSQRHTAKVTVPNQKPAAAARGSRKSKQASRTSSATHSYSEEEQFHVRPDTDAEPDALGDVHLRAAPTVDPAQPGLTEQPLSLSQTVDRALQEYMLSHDFADFAHTMKVHCCL